jgi:hypothetical protein
MGAEEVPGVRRRLAVGWLVLLVSAGLAAAGCGEESSGETEAPGPLLGPAAPEGDIDPSSARLAASDGFTTLVTSQITTRGDKDALIVGQIELPGAPETARFRLLVDGEPDRDAQVSTVRDGGDTTAVVSCACKLPTGEHEVVLEGTADSGTARVGARSLLILPEVQLDDTSGLALSASALETDPVAVTAEGATLAQARPSGDGGDEPLVILAAVRGPRSEVGAENVRIEMLVGDDPAEELVVTNVPSGKLVAYLDSDGAAVGDAITLRGYVTSGRSVVGVSSLVACSCGLSR